MTAFCGFSAGSRRLNDWGMLVRKECVLPFVFNHGSGWLLSSKVFAKSDKAFEIVPLTNGFVCRA